MLLLMHLFHLEICFYKLLGLSVEVCMDLLAVPPFSPGPFLVSFAFDLLSFAELQRARS